MHNRNSLGFATTTILYALAGVFLVALAGSLVISYNQGQRAKAELKVCVDKNEQLNGLIHKQNESIRMHEDAAAKAQARSKAAQKAAAAALASTRAERERLASLKGGTCAEAIVEIKRGMK